MYEHGRGVHKNDVEAVRWYREAAEQGDATAQFNLGGMYRKGAGIPKDDAKAAYWYHKAAEQGLAEAQGNLGMMYASGTGVSQDYIKAYMWISLAAAQRLERAASLLDDLQRDMTPSQIAQALARSRRWRPGSDTNENQ